MARRKRKDAKLSMIDKDVVFLMLKRGDRIQDVAYWFGVSPSTVHKIKKTWVEGAMLRYGLDLPPPGPYALVQRSVLDELAVHKAEAVVAELEAVLLRYKSSSGVLPIRRTDTG